MPYTTAPQNSVITVPLELLPVMKLLLKDELSVAMVKILITLSPSQKEGLMHEATRALHLNRAIAHLQETAMARLDLRLQKKKENESLP